MKKRSGWKKVIAGFLTLSMSILPITDCVLANEAFSAEDGAFQEGEAYSGESSEFVQPEGTGDLDEQSEQGALLADDSEDSDEGSLQESDWEEDYDLILSGQDFSAESIEGALMEEGAIQNGDAENLSIEIGNASALPGATVDVDVTISKNPGIVGGELEISFDNKLELTAASSGEAFKDLTMTKPGVFESPCKFIWDAGNYSSDNISDGTILTLTFQVKDTAVGGDSLGINIDSFQGYSYLDLENPVTASVQGGAVNITESEGDASLISSATAYLTEDGATVSIYSSDAYDNAVLIMAGYTAFGRIGDRKSQKVSLKKGSNTISFTGISSGLTYHAMLLDSRKRPMFKKIPVLDENPESSLAALLGADESQPGIFVERVTGIPGDTVVMNVRLRNNPGILGATLTLNYNNDLLSLTKAVSGPAFRRLSFDKSGKLTSPCKFMWDAVDLSDDDIMDGIILTLSFEISGEAVTPVTTPVRFSFERDDVIDRESKPVDLSVNNGSIAIVDYVPGDVNGDHYVRINDVVLIRRHILGGYDITINEDAADVNADKAVNTKDVVFVRKHIAGGYGVELLPSGNICSHELEEVAEKAATETEDGNIHYWHCDICGRYYIDEEAENEISYDDTVIRASRLEEGEYHVFYHLDDGDPYIMSMVSEGKISNPDNPDKFNSANGMFLNPPVWENFGYQFNGWYDALSTSSDAVRIQKIEAGTEHDVHLYAHWTEYVYNITYKLYQTPLQPITDEKFLHYKPSTGLADLPNPTLYNYIFLGWYTDEGKEVKSIEPGTMGDITLNAYWTSKRNLARKAGGQDPFVFEDVSNGVFYFAYELGTIENIPLSRAAWTIQGVSGLEQQVSKTLNDTISETQAKSTTKNIARATIESDTWRLSEDWNDVVQINKEWATEQNLTQEEAEERAKSVSNSYCITDSNGGNKVDVKNGGTSTLTYESKINHDGTVDRTGETTHLEGSVEGKFTHRSGINAGVIAAKNEFEIGVSVESGQEKYDYKDTTNLNDTHSGSDTTKIDTTAHTDTLTWNHDESRQNTIAASERESVRRAISESISKKTGYGESYMFGGGSSQEYGLSTSRNEDIGTSASLTYFHSTMNETTTTYKADGKSEGWYRLVLAGKAHVFALIGYDVSSKSYFANSFSIMDDEYYEFLDYSPSSSFNDCENSVLALEVPASVDNYVKSKICYTDGLVFEYNSVRHTAIVSGYNGSSEDVYIPSYVSEGKIAYKVIGIKRNAFEGSAIRAIALNRFIDEIPAGAFKNCTMLEEVSGYFTKIGSEAFSGCESLEDFTVSSSVTAIGADAFKDVPSVKVNVLKAEAALALAKAENPDAPDTELNQLAWSRTQNLIDAALQSGARRITLNIGEVINGDGLDFTVPAMDYFELQGESRTYKDLRVSSDAQATCLKQLFIEDCSRIPLDISSSELTLEVVHVDGPSYSLLLSNENVTLHLVRDSVLSSGSGRAMLCQYVTVDSGSGGTLDVNGSILACGDAAKDALESSSAVRVSNGKIESITSVEFNALIKGNYKLNLDANGGTFDQGDGGGSWKALDKAIDLPIGSLPVPKRENYGFTGWYTESSGGTVMDASQAYSDGADHTLFAHWELNQFKLFFDANGGSCSEESRTISVGQAVGTLPTPQRTGYTFDGWFLSNGSKISATTSFSEKKDQNVKAQWSGNRYTVSFNGNGGTPSSSSITVTYNNAYGTLPSASRTGYSFSGWYTAASGGDKVTAGTNMTKTANHTLYAHWSINSYTVSFNANGGSCSTSSKTVTYNSSYGTLPTPSRSGYNFDGWYTASSGGSKVVSSTTVTNGSNHTLYAHWNRIRVTIPDFTGQHVNDVTNWCNNNGVSYSTHLAYDWAVAADRIRSNSHAGSTVDWGSTTINLYVSRGAKPIAVGDTVFVDYNTRYWSNSSGTGSWGTYVTDKTRVVKAIAPGTACPYNTDWDGWVPASAVHQRTN